MAVQVRFLLVVLFFCPRIFFAVFVFTLPCSLSVLCNLFPDKNPWNFLPFPEGIFCGRAKYKNGPLHHLSRKGVKTRERRGVQTKRTDSERVRGAGREGGIERGRGRRGNQGRGAEREKGREAEVLRVKGRGEMKEEAISRIN